MQPRTMAAPLDEGKNNRRFQTSARLLQRRLDKSFRAEQTEPVNQRSEPSGGAQPLRSGAPRLQEVAHLTS